MKHNRATLFLTELIFCLLIFALSTVVCVGLLSHAKQISLESTELTDAVYLAQSGLEGRIDGYDIARTPASDDTILVTVEKNGRTIYTLSMGVRP
ncbi:MAG: hypothetical protein RR053_02920 [Evtepia sp.]